MTLSITSRSLAPVTVATLGLAPFALTATARGQPSRALIEARRPMRNAEIHTLTFRSMEQLFDTLRVERESQPWHLEEQPAPLDFTYIQKRRSMSGAS
jgi:hypothetical protein